jgi:hypothetical protein
MSEFGDDLKLVRHEQSSGSDTIRWHQRRDIKSGVVVEGDGGFSNASTVDICEFFSANGFPTPGPEGHSVPDTIIVTVQNGQARMEMAGSAAKIPNAFPSDYISSSGPDTVPSTIVKRDWTGSAVAAIELTRVDGTKVSIVARPFEGGFCLGPVDDLSGCVESAYLSHAGPVLLQYRQEYMALVGLVSRTISRIRVDFGDGGSINWVPPKPEVVLPFIGSYLIVSIPIPAGEAVVGTVGFDQNGNEVR